MYFFSWENPTLGTGLRVSYQQSNWRIRETQTQDKQFYQSLLGNPDFMKYIHAGKPLNPDFVSTCVEDWVNKFSEGNPSSRLLIEQEHESVGFVQLTSFESPGLGKLQVGISPKVQGKGLGKAAIGFIVNEWGPAVRKHGLGLSIKKGNASIQKFQCFKNEPLQYIYASARPSNQASWQCFKYFGFKPSPATNQSTQISLENYEQTQHGSIEEFLLKHHFSPGATNPLQPNERYEMIDEHGGVKTLSFVTDYNSLRYHFEKKVE